MNERTHDGLPLHQPFPSSLSVPSSSPSVPSSAPLSAPAASLPASLASAMLAVSAYLRSAARAAAAGLGRRGRHEERGGLELLPQQPQLGLPVGVSLDAVLTAFWENHNPTQGMRQGNDHGSQYRSAVYAYSEQQLSQVQASAAIFQEALNVAGYGQITSELSMAGEFYYAEHYHQQYLAKVPNGYCGLGGTGVGCDLGALGVDL